MRVNQKDIPTKKNISTIVYSSIDPIFQPIYTKLFKLFGQSGLENLNITLHINLKVDPFYLELICQAEIFGQSRCNQKYI